MTTEHLPARLRQLRQAAGLSQHELANRAGATLSLITKLEQGVVTNPKLDSAARIAAALGCTVDDLLQPATGKGKKR